MRKHHAFIGKLVEVRRRHAAGFATEIGPEIAIAGVVGNDEENVGILLRLAKVTPGDTEQTSATVAKLVNSLLDITDVSLLSPSIQGRCGGAAARPLFQEVWKFPLQFGTRFR